jgi:RimJ/RimL family protein N-acetyltransferase
LTEGSGVVTSRGDIHYVVTEYGIATLRGRSIRERALEMIQIAHPKFRDQLLRQVRDQAWVPAYQEQKYSEAPDIDKFEIQKLKLKDGVYLLRALGPSDERRLQEFFYSHNPDSIYQRYRSMVNKMPRETAYKLVNVDQNVDLALCIVERQGPREIIHAVGRYYLEPKENRAEVAFIVRETKRKMGMASIILENLIATAKQRNILQLFAFVRNDNYPMITIFSKFGFEKKETDEMMESYFTLDLVECLPN